MDALIFNLQRFATIKGTGSSDYLRNTVAGSVVLGLAGNDRIYNSGNNVKIDAGAGDDSVYSSNGSYSGAYVTIDGGAGNDTIVGRFGGSSISGGEGSDRISMAGDVDYATINGGKGNDAIYNDTLDGRNFFQYAYGDGNDIIYNISDYDTISISGATYTRSTVGSNLVLNVTGGGAITLSGARSKTPVIIGTVESGIIRNTVSGATVNGTSGKDVISNTGSTVKIYGNAGDDSIYSSNDRYSGAYVTIDGGAGNDTIVGRFGDSSISGGEGADVISLAGDVDRATISGGKGNDIIYGDNYDGRNVYEYSVGDGYDTVYYAGSNDTLKLNTAAYTTIKSGSDLIVSLASGSVNFKNTSDINIASPNGVSILSSTDDTILNGTAYGDTIKNIYGNSGGDRVTINAGAGDDIIYNDYGWHVKVNAGDGNDTITDVRGSDGSINGGAGDDRISLNSSRGVLTVKGGTGADTIYGDTVGSYGVVYQYTSGDGNDVIYNFHSNDTLTGATFTSVKSGSNLILNMAGGGKVTLVGASTIAAETFTEGDDYYSNTASNTVLSALAGNDTIVNGAVKVTIDAGDGNDSISNTAVSITAYGGSGDDRIYNKNGDYSYIDLGDGADSIYAYDNDSVTVNAGAGNDTITGYYYASKIDGGAGADRISVLSGANTIDGGDGNDTISAYNGSINGGAGDDRITLNGNYAGRIVKGGTGNDTIYGGSSGSYGNTYQYAYGDGSDVIYNYNSNDTISIVGSAEYTTLTGGSNKVVVSVLGSGAMTLNGASGKNLIVKGGSYVPTSGAVYITNSTSNMTLTGTKYGDTIENIYKGGGDTVSINADAGDDLISNTYGYYITIDAGAGNDTIISSRGSSNSVNGGAGDDVISISSSHGLTVVKGGAGNDTVYGDSIAHIYQYENGDGYDVINGYNANDTITITGGDWSKSTVGSDVIIKITNSNSTVQTGAITLSGAKGKTINIYPTVAAVTVPPETDTGTGTATVSSVTQQEVIQKFMGVLDTVNSDGVNRLNQAVSVASGGYFTNINAAINQMVNDCESAGNANDFLVNKCGIILNNNDTGAITGSDAGGSATKTAQSIVPESGSLNSFTGNSYTTNGLSIQLANFGYDGTPHSLSFSSLTNKQQYMWQGLYTWWLKGSFDLIAESYGDNYGFGSNSSASVNKMYVEFYRANDNALASVTHWFSPSTGVASQLRLRVNMNYYNDVNTSDPNGSTSTSGAGYLDRTLAHELTHAVMAANINYFASLPVIIKEGMAELTHGIDDERGNDILKLAANPTLLQQALRLSTSYNYNVSGVWAPDYAGGYMFLRYLAKQSAENASSGSSDNMSAIISSSNNSSSGSVTTQRGVTIKNNVLTASSTFDEDMIDLSTYASTVTKVNASALTEGIMIIGNTNANSIGAGKGNDTVSGNTGNDTILGGAGNDVLFGDAGNDKISGDAGNDTLSGGYGNDTLTGGAGNDVFVHIAGNDVIADYAAGQDKIQLIDENLISSSLSSSNLILTTTNGTINIKSGKGKQITIIDRDGNETTGTYPAGGGATNSGISVSGAVLTASTVFSGDTIDLADYASAVTKVNAANLTQDINILGNSKANSIKAGKGNDTVYGEAGNDTIYTGNGADILYGGAGNDKLYGEAGNDTLYGGAGNDTLTGGAGNDIFVYEAGNDFIADYTVGQDKIKISTGSITGAAVSSSNVILNISTGGKITVKGGKDKNITVIDSSEKETTQIYPSKLSYDDNKSAATLAADFTGTLRAADYESTVSKIDASKVSKAINIVGNAQSNTIIGGAKADTIYGGAGDDSIFGAAGADKLYGDAGADTLRGGAGNDTLTGGDDKDVFVYGSGDGKDVITDYAAGDKIKITSGAITKTSVSGGNVIFTIGSGSITVKDGGGKKITIVDSSGKSTTQTYSNLASSADLLDDDNFISNDIKLDEITAVDFDVTSLQTMNSELFAQEKPLLTFHKDK